MFRLSTLLGKEFVAIPRDRPLPRLAGCGGATFCIYWGQVSADSDGPIEWCKPVPVAEGKALAAQYPELNLRTEPAHREAFVALPAGGRADPVQWQLASEALHAWAGERGNLTTALTTLFGLVPVAIIPLISLSATSDSSKPKMNAAPFLTPPLDARVRMNAVSGIGGDTEHPVHGVQALRCRTRPDPCLTQISLSGRGPMRGSPAVVRPRPPRRGKGWPLPFTLLGGCFCGPREV